LDHKKGTLGYKPRESDISPICLYAPYGSIVLNFGVRDEIADIITDVKFYVIRFRGFGAVTPGNMGISIGMADGSYTSVSMAMLHCNLARSAKVAERAIYFTVRNFFVFFIFLMISRRQIISRSTEPIFAIFISNESFLRVDDRSGHLFLSKGTLPWQPILCKNGARSEQIWEQSPHGI